MPLTPDQERWAFAAKLMEIHGEDVGIYIVGRIEDLRQNDDTGGVRFWIAIADKVAQLAGPDEGALTQ